MANFCIPKDLTKKLIQGFKDGSITPEKLIDMSSKERRDLFAIYVGDEFASEINARAEGKIILKGNSSKADGAEKDAIILKAQKDGILNWAKKVTGITEATRNDIIAKIERMTNVLEAKNEDAFLQDLATKKMGAEISYEEAQRITEGVKAVNEARAKINFDPKSPGYTPNDAPERIEYGIKARAFQKYIADLKFKGSEVTWNEWIKSPSRIFDTIAGTTKSILASFDNSFFGRQGVKMLYTNPGIWGDSFLKSWGDIAKEVRGTDAVDAIYADVLSRDNALNGKYDASGLDLGGSEEAFPESLPEMIPVLGRLYKASESAFNGAALRMRADYADKLIPLAEAAGVDFKVPLQAKGLGILVNSMTGRGDIGKLGIMGKEINAGLFSVKFLKSNFDTLTANRLGFQFEKGPMRSFARKQAATNLFKIIATQAVIMTTANLLYPGSAELDPRSSNFGKLKIGNTTIDLSGGMGSLVTLAARITPTYHDGTFSFWYKSTTGKWTDLVAGKYGQNNAMDVIISFGEGKLSPLAGIARDAWVGKNYNGEKPTVENEAAGLVTPLPIQDYQQLHSPDAAHTFGLMLVDLMGFSTQGPSTPAKK